jgi:hypothetical protein
MTLTMGVFYRSSLIAYQNRSFLSIPLLNVWLTPKVERPFEAEVEATYEYGDPELNGLAFGKYEWHPTTKIRALS